MDKYSGISFQFVTYHLRGLPYLERLSLPCALKSNLGYAARIMSLYRLRALPGVKENNDLVGYIIAKRMIKAIHYLGADLVSLCKDTI